MSYHAPLSPSAAHRWMACPGSIREESKYPEPPSNPAAIDGTHTHSLLEHCLNNYMLDAASMVGQKMSDHEGEFVIDAERAARVQVALDYVYRRIAEISDMKQQVVIITEERVNPGALLGRDDLTGTADVQLVSDDYLEIIDYKDGVGEVLAENNPQLLLYALGALKGETPLYVRMTIVQPKLAMMGKEPITSHEIMLDQLMSRIAEFKTAAAAVDAPDAPLLPGEVQCKWCRAKGGCAVLAQQSMEAVGVLFNQDMVDQVVADEPNQLSDDKIREILEAAPLLRQMLEAVETEALRRFESGTVIDGLKAVRGRGSRSWAMTDEEIAERLKKMGIPKTAFYQTKLVTPSQVKKLVWEKRDGTKKQLSERQIETLEKEYVSKTPGKLQIVPVSDSREAVELSAAPMFGAVEQGLPDWMK
jgi:hypothetical protein